MNLVNLFGNKTKQPEPEYFLAVEIHESLIKTALWEILAGEPQVISVGSYESWADEESLINGVDASLEQATKVIKGQPRRVIFGLPDSWMDGLKIHSTKTKLITHLIKELGLEPIGMVAINQAIAHYLKKCEGMPPTSILLEIYTSKIAVSYIYLGEVKATEEVAKSGDIARDVEEGLARMELLNYPARFILTNGSTLEEEVDQITAYPWQERLPFKHLPKVEVLPIDFSVKAVAMTGGAEAAQFLGVEIKSDPGDTEQTNILVPEETPATMEELGFSYEETSAPSTISEAITITESSPPDYVEPEYAIPQEETDEDHPARDSFSFQFPFSFHLKLPRFPQLHFRWLSLLIIPLLLGLGFLAYLLGGKALITIHFTPQKISKELKIAIADTAQSSLPTLLATKRTVTSSAKESISTTGTAMVGDKSTGAITIVNKTTTPIILKAGTLITSDTGKYNFTLQSVVTVASASSDFYVTTNGKATGIQVTATKIGAEYNLGKNTTFAVAGFSQAVISAISETDFTGGTSRTVNAVSKSDQDKLLVLTTEKIKSQVQNETKSQSPGSKSLPLSDIQFTKKQFDHNIGEEATVLNLDLSASLDILIYSEDNLYNLVAGELKDQIPSGSYTTKESTTITMATPVKVGDSYQTTVTTNASLFPSVDEEKLANYVKGKPASSLRHFFEPIRGFVGADIKISPPIPFITQILPFRNIKFQLVGQ